MVYRRAGPLPARPFREPCHQLQKSEGNGPQLAPGLITGIPYGNPRFGRRPRPPNLQDQGFEAAGIEAFGPEEVIAFVDKILGGDCRMDARKQLERSVTKFFADFDDERRFFLAVTREGQLCGFTAIDRYNDRTATLKWIFVAGEFRGRKMGSWLLVAALSHALEAGYEKAILRTATKMEAAHKLYRNNGFVFKQWVTFWRERMQVYENVLVKIDSE